MNKTICSTIRRQLDEMVLGEQLALDVSRHLNECAACCDFHDKQTKLRQLVGSLGTVNAPSDFDFRLRARLASENSTGSHRVTRSSWFYVLRGAVAVAAVAVMMGAFFQARRYEKGNNPETAVQKTQSSGAPNLIHAVTNQNNQTPAGSGQTARAQEGNEKQKLAKPNSSGPVRSNRLVLSEDLASSRAPVVRAQQQTSEPIFPVDASQQSLRVSLFDGRGNPRTISLPPVTFGSQRVVPTTTSFAPKGVW